MFFYSRTLGVSSKFVFVKWSSEWAELVFLPYFCGSYTHILKDIFFLTIPRCYEDAYVDNFVRKPGPGIFLPAECFPVIYDLNFIRSLVGFFYLTALLSQFFLATSYPSFPLF